MHSKYQLNNTIKLSGMLLYLIFLSKDFETLGSVDILKIIDFK